MTRPRRPARAAALLLAALLAAPALGRTVTLTDADCDRMACLTAAAPRQSWAAYEVVAGTFITSVIDVTAQRSLLLRFPLGRIPPGQRVTAAELVLPVQLHGPGEQRLYVRRVVGEWGAGVCHQYRMTRPRKVEWKVPGARGSAADRAAKPTAVARVAAAGDQTVNVTEDVELWYAEPGLNQGWMLTVEDADGLVRLGSPLWTAQGQFKLRITYEPQ